MFPSKSAGSTKLYRLHYRVGDLLQMRNKHFVSAACHTGTFRVNKALRSTAETEEREEAREGGGGGGSAENITVTRWFDSSAIHMASSSSCSGQSVPTRFALDSQEEDARYQKAVFL